MRPLFVVVDEIRIEIMEKIGLVPSNLAFICDASIDAFVTPSPNQKVPTNEGTPLKNEDNPISLFEEADILLSLAQCERKQSESDDLFKFLNVAAQYILQAKSLDLKFFSLLKKLVLSLVESRAFLNFNFNLLFEEFGEYFIALFSLYLACGYFYHFVIRKIFGALF